MKRFKVDIIVNGKLYKRGEVVPEWLAELVTQFVEEEEDANAGSYSDDTELREHKVVDQRSQGRRNRPSAGG